MSETYAFNMMYSRIWQFAIGMISYLFATSEEKNENYESKMSLMDEKCEKLSKEAIFVLAKNYLPSNKGSA